MPNAYDKLATIVADKAFTRSPNYVLLREVGMTQDKMPTWKANRSQATIIARAKAIVESNSIPRRVRAKRIRVPKK